MSPMLHCIKHSMEDIVHYRCIRTTCYTYLHLHLHSLVISTSYNSSLYFRETEICMAFFRCMQQISTCDQFLAKFCGTTLANVCKRSSGWIRYDNHIHITQPSAKYMYLILNRIYDSALGCVIWIWLSTSGYAMVVHGRPKTPKIQVLGVTQPPGVAESI